MREKEKESCMPLIKMIYHKVIIIKLGHIIQKKRRFKIACGCGLFQIILSFGVFHKKAPLCYDFFAEIS